MALGKWEYAHSSPIRRDVSNRRSWRWANDNLPTAARVVDVSSNRKSWRWANENLPTAAQEGRRKLALGKWQSAHSCQRTEIGAGQVTTRPQRPRRKDEDGAGHMAIANLPTAARERTRDHLSSI